MIPLYNTYIFEYNIGYIESVIRGGEIGQVREMNEKEKHYIFLFFLNKMGRRAFPSKIVFFGDLIANFIKTTHKKWELEKKRVTTN